MKSSPETLALGLSMLAAAGLAIAITPTSKIADQGPKIDLETMTTKQFGEWKIAAATLSIGPNPQSVSG